MKSSILAVSAMAILVVLLLPAPGGALTCSDVITDLSPCIQYLVSGKGSPSTACCAGASKLASAASTSADKKTACNCMKTTAQKVNTNPAAAQALPGSCGIALPFPVSASVDCSKYSFPPFSY